jgi:hypothetical protein
MNKTNEGNKATKNTFVNLQEYKENRMFYYHNGNYLLCIVDKTVQRQPKVATRSS